MILSAFCSPRILLVEIRSPLHMANFGLNRLIRFPLTCLCACPSILPPRLASFIQENLSIRPVWCWVFARISARNTRVSNKILVDEAKLRNMVWIILWDGSKMRAEATVPSISLFIQRYVTPRIMGQRDRETNPQKKNICGHMWSRSSASLSLDRSSWTNRGLTWILNK